MQKVIQKVQLTKDSRRNLEVPVLQPDHIKVAENDPPQESARDTWDFFKKQVTETRPAERMKVKCTTRNEKFAGATML